MHKCQLQVLLPAPTSTVRVVGQAYCRRVLRSYPAADRKLGTRVITGSLEHHTLATGGRG